MPVLSDFQSSFYGLRQQGSDAFQKSVPLVVIAWQCRDADATRAWNDTLLRRAADLIFNGFPSVRDYFAATSLNRCILKPHPDLAFPIIGPVVSDKAASWFTATDNNNEGFRNRYHYSYMEAVKAAVRLHGINLFKQFDVSGVGELSVDECLVMIIKRDVNAHGYRRSINSSEIPSDVRLTLEGLRFTDIAEWYISGDFTDERRNAGNVAVGIEETLHLAVRIADQYPERVNPLDPGRTLYRRDDDPGRPGSLSITDAGGRAVLPDPYQRLKWGWLTPQLVTTPGYYTLRPAATSGDALIVPAPSGNTREFFLVEYRNRDGYDRFCQEGMNSGIAIWHCIQDAALTDQWGRRAINLRRAQPGVTNGQFNLPFTLFNGERPETSYELSINSSPQNLAFANEVSNVVMRDFSTAGETMSLYIDFDRVHVLNRPGLRVDWIRNLPREWPLRFKNPPR